MRITAYVLRLRRALLLIVALGALYPAASDAQTVRSGKLSPVLRARSGQLSGRSRVIVQFHGTPDTRIITGGGGVAGRQLASAGAQVAELDNRTLADIARNPQVAWVGADHPAFPTLERTGAAIAANLARQTFKLTGQGVGIAVIDSGITAWHDDLYLAGPRSARPAPRVVHFKDFTVPDNPRIWTSGQPSDEYGHGTHVAGIIAGNGFDSDGARTGVAPGANLVGLKVLDAEGHGYISDVIAAIDYAIAIRKVYNIRVINLSVASGVFDSYRTDPLTLAARRAVDAGIVVVAAAGNLGTNAAGETQFGGITSPGNAPWVLTVGASSHQGTAARSNDTLARFSSRGPTWIDFSAKPDLVAPGLGIESLSDPHSSLYATHADYLLDGTRRTRYKPYLSLSGTSMAAPVVAGTVALMIEANPDLTPNAVKAILQYTAEVRDNESFLVQGAGLLNALGAVRMAEFFAAPTKGIPAPGDTIENEAIEWSRHLIWGNHRIDGGIPLPGSNAWSLSVTWGAEATRAGRPIVWGVDDDDNIVWSTDDDDNIVWSTDDDDNIVWSTDDDDNIVWSTDDDDNIVWSTDDDDNIVWSTDDDDNIVWSTDDDDNIVWSTAHSENIVWGTDCGGANCTRVIWGSRADSGLIWGTSDDDDNIVWSTDDDDNIVWSTDDDDNIVWSTDDDDNIVWSTDDDDNIVWSTGSVDQILWATAQPVEYRRGTTPGGR